MVEKVKKKCRLAKQKVFSDYANTNWRIYVRKFFLFFFLLASLLLYALLDLLCYY